MNITNINFQLFEEVDTDGNNVLSLEEMYGFDMSSGYNILPDFIIEKLIISGNVDLLTGIGAPPELVNKATNEHNIDHKLFDIDIENLLSSFIFEEVEKKDEL